MKNLHVLIAKINGCPVGSAMLATNDSIAGLYWCNVHPDYRKQGISTALAHARMSIARGLGYDQIISQTLPLAINLYRQLGFVSIGSLPLYITRNGDN